MQIHLENYLLYVLRENIESTIRLPATISSRQKIRTYGLKSD